MNDDQWYVTNECETTIGPVTGDQIRRGLAVGEIVTSALACRVGASEWLPIVSIPEFAPRAKLVSTKSKHSVPAVSDPSRDTQTKPSSSASPGRDRRLKTLAVLVIGLVATSTVIALVLLGARLLGAGPVELVKSYLNEDKCTDRAKYILDGPANLPALENYYRETKSCSKPFIGLTPDGCEKMAVGDYCSVEAKFKDSTSYYHVKKTADGYKLDWRSSVEFNPMSMLAFEAARPTRPQLFRVRAQLKSYYNYEYRDAESSHQSIQISSGGEILTGYIRRNAPSAPALLDLLKDGATHAVIVELKYLPGSRESSVFEIERFVASRWRQQPEEVGTVTPTTPSSSAVTNSQAAPPPSAVARVNECDVLAGLASNHPPECARLFYCCCVADPPNPLKVVGQSKMADVLCAALVTQLPETAKACTQARETVLELYATDKKLGNKVRVPSACN